MMWRIISFYLFSFLVSHSLTGQSASGLYLGKYAGVNGIIINPASARSYSHRWELNLASFNAFGHIDYLFVKETNLFHLFNNMNSLSRFPIDQINLPPDRLYYDFPLEIFSPKGSTQIEVNGPGFLYNFDNYSIGLFSRLRATGGNHSIPSSLSYFGVQNSFRNTEIISGKASASGLLWSEYGLSFSFDRLVEVEGLSIGANVKYIRAHHGAYAKSFNSFSYNRITEDSLQLIQPQFEFGITSVTADETSFSMPSNGSGISIDLGLSLVKPIGIINFSILDIGFVRVKNGEVYTLQSTQDILLNTQPLEDASSIRTQIEEIDRQISDQLDRIPTILTSQQFSVGMPTRLHLDFTYDLKKGRSLLVSVDQRIPLFTHSLEAENVITIAPRYEDRWWMITTPISIYEHSKVRVGLAAKIAFLTIGTDHITSLISKSDFRGSSLYAGIKIFPFWQKDATGQSNKRKGVICPLP